MRIFSLCLCLSLTLFASEKLRVIVTGPEHSGTRWVAGLMYMHPQIDIVGHASFPCGGKWPTTAKNYHRGPERGERVKVLLCTRDKSCVIRSGERRSKKNQNSNKRALIEEALTRIKGELDQIDKKDIVVISYESLLLHKELVLRQTFRLLGLDEDIYDYDCSGFLNFNGWIKVNLDGRDGNKKYILRGHKGTWE